LVQDRKPIMTGARDSISKQRVIISEGRVETGRPPSLPLWAPQRGSQRLLQNDLSRKKEVN
jgi:hypothetical protein